jgi:hypothetical protein
MEQCVRVPRPSAPSNGPGSSAVASSNDCVGSSGGGSTEEELNCKTRQGLSCSTNAPRTRSSWVSDLLRVKSRGSGCVVKSPSKALVGSDRAGVSRVRHSRASWDPLASLRKASHEPNDNQSARPAAAGRGKSTRGSTRGSVKLRKLEIARTASRRIDRQQVGRARRSAAACAAARRAASSSRDPSSTRARAAPRLCPVPRSSPCRTSPPTRAAACCATVPSASTRQRALRQYGRRSPRGRPT